jgi:hypothetical protein
MTIINYNNGRISDKVQQKKKPNVRQKSNRVRQSRLQLYRLMMEQRKGNSGLHPPELNQQNVFYAEEAERKLIVAIQRTSCTFCRVK